MATLVSLTLDVIDLLYGQAKLTRPAVDQLAVAVASNSDTSLQFERAGSSMWEYGDYAEAVDGTGTAGEVIQFFGDHDVPDADVRVTRGARRSTAASSHAVGTVWWKNPAFTHVEIQKEINATIDSDMQNGVWYRSQGTIAYSTGRDRYPIAANVDKIERLRQRDINSTALGTTVFVFTGGTVEDEWTFASAHGLAVGDMVRFTAVGTGADEYGQGIIYFVATVDSTTVVTLSATDSTTVLEGSADSVGTWSAEKVVMDYREFHSGDYTLLTNQDTTATSTTQDLIVRRVASSSDTLYYTARVRPESSAVASLPTEISNAVPYGAVARLIGGTAARGRPASDSTIQYADAGWFRAEYNRQIDDVRKRLLKELRPLKEFEYGPTTSGSHRGGSGRDQSW